MSTSLLILENHKLSVNITLAASALQRKVDEPLNLQFWSYSFTVAFGALSKKNAYASFFISLILSHYQISDFTNPKQHQDNLQIILFGIIIVDLRPYHRSQLIEYKQTTSVCKCQYYWLEMYHMGWSAHAWHFPVIRIMCSLSKIPSMMVMHKNPVCSAIINL